MQNYSVLACCDLLRSFGPYSRRKSRRPNTGTTEKFITNTALNCGHVLFMRVVSDHPIPSACADRFDVREGMDKNNSGVLQAMASSSKGRHFTPSKQKQHPTHSFSASTELIWILRTHSLRFHSFVKFTASRFSSCSEVLKFDSAIECRHAFPQTLFAFGTCLASSLCPHGRGSATTTNNNDYYYYISYYHQYINHPYHEFE